VEPARSDPGAIVAGVVLCAVLAGTALAVDTLAGAAFDAPKRLIAVVGTALAAAVTLASGGGTPRFAGPAGGPRLRRVDLEGRLLEELGPQPLEYFESWSGPMIDRSGRMLLTVGPPDTWFVLPGTLTPGVRPLEPLPVDFYGDIFTPSWSRDGSVLAVGWEYDASIWRFTATPR